MSDESLAGCNRPSNLNRRQLLKTVGVAGASLTALSGIASAHQSQFFGCSQVCTDTQGDYAVVFHQGTYECRPITRASDRSNLPWDWGAYCYESERDEAIVGMIEENVLVGDEIVDDGTCTLCLNPNRCARNYYHNPDDIVAALNDDATCTPCRGRVELGEDCEVYGSSGPSGGGSPQDRGPDKSPHGEGNGKKNGKGHGKANGKKNGKGHGKGHGKEKGNGKVD